MPIKQVIAFLAGFSVCTAAYSAALSPTQESAKERGITLYNQHKAISAEPYLEIAASAGEREAQYYLAEALRLNNRHMTKDAHNWYTAAAEQGDLYAMRRLSSMQSDLCIAMGNCPKGVMSAEDWHNKLLSTATPLAEKGDVEAMYLLYHATNDLEWLEKSAATGYAHAQFWLALRYTEGKKSFLFPWERHEAIDDLFRKSAEGGDPKGISEYYDRLLKEKKLEPARYWLKKGAETGYTVPFFEYAYFLSDPNNPLNLPVDLVASYGLMSLLLELDGGGDMLPLAKDALPRIAA